MPQTRHFRASDYCLRQSGGSVLLTTQCLQSRDVSCPTYQAGCGATRSSVFRGRKAKKYLEDFQGVGGRGGYRTLLALEEVKSSSQM